ncbi:hypothetical protein Q5752_001876 [Cryptotrichosporon argae]
MFHIMIAPPTPQSTKPDPLALPSPPLPASPPDDTVDLHSPSDRRAYASPSSPSLLPLVSAAPNAGLGIPLDAPSSSLTRSSSLRSRGLAEPLADHQSNDVLNATPQLCPAVPVAAHALASGSLPPLLPALPASRKPMRPVPSAGDLLASIRQLEMDDETDGADDDGGHALGASARAGTPTFVRRSLFVPPGLDAWTRDTWATRKVALITGITGQDGSYLTERGSCPKVCMSLSSLPPVLLDKGYEVHGIIRRSSSFNTSRLHHLFPAHAADTGGKLWLHYGDLTDSSNLVHIIASVQPSEVYNLGAQSHVKVSFEMSEYTGDVDGLGALRLLDAIRTCGLTNLVKFYQASTSELYGLTTMEPQSEQTPFHPRSPYGVAKLYAYWITVNYRESYGLFACNGILFNHESPRRGRTFVTRKITRAVAEISLGKQECLYVGNLEASRDWGHARDYVHGMWLMLQHDNANDFVLSTHSTHTVREFVEKAFAVLSIPIAWRGRATGETGIDARTGRVLVRVDERYFRPAEVDYLLGDCSKAETVLGWKRAIDFDTLVREMVVADLESAKYLVEDHN